MVDSHHDNKIYTVHCSFDSQNDADLKYALDINFAGRRVVEDRGDMRPVPLSLWPKILTRAYDELYNNPTVLYYLLRNGPALAGRVTLDSTTAECEDGDGDGDGVKDGDDCDDDNTTTTTTKHSLKRKYADTGISNETVVHGE